MTQQTPASIVKLPSNLHGKDYVIGDLHGCLELLQRLLDQVQFDQTCDRLFSVGDLIDRGPDSMACLQLLNQPWFYAVKGNHEKMMLDCFQSYFADQQLASIDVDDLMSFYWNGGDWVDQHFLQDQQRMSAEFEQGLLLAEQLPQLMIIGDEAQRFHVFHAELSKPRVNGELEVWLDSDIDQWLLQGSIPERISSSLYWARSLMSEYSYSRDRSMQAGLSASFCGHTLDKQPRQMLSHICLDTGAFVSLDRDGEHFALTLYDVREQCWHSASYQRLHLISGSLPTAVITRD